MEERQQKDNKVTVHFTKEMQQDKEIVVMRTKVITKA